MLHISLFIFYYPTHVSVLLEPSSGRHVQEYVIELKEWKHVADCTIQRTDNVTFNKCI
jgi:hypothetical protein